MQVEQPRRAGVEATQAGLGVDHQHGHADVFKNGLEIGVDGDQRVAACLRFFVDGEQFFVGRLQLFVGGLQFFIGRLQFFVGSLEFLGESLHLLVGGLELFHQGLQMLPIRDQFVLECLQLLLRLDRNAGVCVVGWQCVAVFARERDQEQPLLVERHGMYRQLQ